MKKIVLMLRVCRCADVKIFFLIVFFPSVVIQASYEDPFNFDKNIKQEKNTIIQIPKLQSPIGSIVMHFWDKHLTKLDGARCPMYPTCSHFFRLVLAKEGISKAVVKTLARILKETPDMRSYDEYPLILKHGRYRFFDPIENYDLSYENIDVD